MLLTKIKSLAKAYKDEVIANILQKVLYLFCAPEREKYYLIPSIDK